MPVYHDDHDIRWRQRLDNYVRALDQLNAAVEIHRRRELSDLERQGLIKAFEFTHELAWNVMKDYIEYQGTTSITGSRDAMREAFRRGLVTDGEGWMETIVSRNLSSHTYNEGLAREIVAKVVSRYLGLFTALRTKLQELANAAGG